VSSRPRRRRLSYYRLTVTLRLRRSWTHWCRRRRLRRLNREQNRLNLLIELEANQLHRVRLLEQELYPPEPAPEPLQPPPLPLPSPPPETEPAPVTQAPVTLEHLFPQPEPEPEPEPEMPDPRLEIAQLLGLPPRQSTYQDSEN
jgi:hypothetical protein